VFVDIFSATNLGVRILVPDHTPLAKLTVNYSSLRPCNRRHLAKLAQGSYQAVRPGEDADIRFTFKRLMVACSREGDVSEFFRFWRYGSWFSFA
jgi:hypothetical protein